MPPIPRKIGLETAFEAHGRRFHCRKIGRNTWILTCPLVSGRARFGDLAQIREDVATVLECGSMPFAANSMA